MARSDAGKGKSAKATKAAKAAKAADRAAGPAKSARRAKPPKKASAREITADDRLDELTKNCKMPDPYPAYVVVLEGLGNRKVMTGTHFGTINSPNPKFKVSLENVCSNDKTVPVLKLTITPV
jgi:hypothetical protein